MTEAMRIDSAGNVGIGTTSPATLLELDDSTNGGTYNESPTTGLVIHGDNNSTATSRGNLTIMTANNQAIDMGGNLTFGGRFTDSISTTVNFSQISGRKSNSTSANKEGYLAFATRRPVMTEAMRIDSAGNVGIGTTSPSYKLHVNGTAYATGAAGALSDIRHKKNVQPISDGALKIINGLRPVTYEWKNPVDSGMEGTQIGFIAQEVEKFLPEVVITQDDEDKTKALKYNEFIPVIIKAVKELKTENDTIKESVMTIKEENKTLKAENEQLRNALASLTDRQTALEDMFLSNSTALPKEKLVKLGDVEKN
ncbi:MAG: hypothetical protein GY774_16275 [Planctomycetes bacterium]|nr:hypothetical protein [Planctomycetota bacterium]